MGRSARVRAGLAAVGLSVPFVLVGCGSGTTTTSSDASTTTAAPAAVNNGASVSIGEFAYNAPEVTVKAGQTVTWKNDGSAKHTVTGGSADFKNSPNLDPGGAPYVQTFATPGTYEYYCSIHGKTKMAGKVIVQ